MVLVLDLLLIFALRTLDVGMGTVRIVLLARGRRGTAAAIGFFEALVWVIAVSRVLAGLDDPARMVAFAAGFASGTFVGSMVEEWLAIGQSLIRVVTASGSSPVAPVIRGQGFGATVVNGDGMNGEVQVTFTVVPRRSVGEVTKLVHRVNPDAYVTIETTSSIDLRQRHDRDVGK
ncbi:MAG: DUF5698 domain-containing protein [Actinobacteria bacterium]|nr:DUF5698 domain-containing protein [Actinomycetota bacterium]MCI0678669.1 DUF5698 domain-containing protein [Actinomycetota bacterium]